MMNFDATTIFHTEHMNSHNFSHWLKSCEHVDAVANNLQKKMIFGFIFHC